MLKVPRLTPTPLERVIWVKLEAIWGAWVPLRLCGVTAGSHVGDALGCCKTLHTPRDIPVPMRRPGDKPLACTRVQGTQ